LYVFFYPFLHFCSPTQKRQLDKPGLLTQHVACRAEANNFLDCHYPGRTLCELMVTCGYFNRPPPVTVPSCMGTMSHNKFPAIEAIPIFAGPNDRTMALNIESVIEWKGIRCI
jgi:hypothetical protein